VHGAYEGDMIDAAIDDILTDLPNALGGGHGMQLVQGGRAAGFATIALMKRTRTTIPPKDIVDKYVEIVAAGKKHDAAELLWDKFHQDTIKVLADGCKTLAMIWESAWVEGGGGNIPPEKLKKITTTRLRQIYEKPDFLPSKALGQIDEFL